MSPDLEKQIKKLSISERIHLVEEIWDGIARENESFELTPAQRSELERRARSFASGRTWEEIRADFLRP